MLLFYWITGMLLAAVWLWQLGNVVFGMSKVIDISKPEWDAAPAELPRLSVIVPARNEAEHIRACLTSLLSLDYAALEVIAVNDRSTDATGDLMNEVAASAPHGRLSIVHVTELPGRWLGKTHAMWRGASQS